MAAFNTAAVAKVHCLEFMQRAFLSKGVLSGKEKTLGTAAASITACRLQSKIDYIIYVLTNWH